MLNNHIYIIDDEEEILNQLKDGVESNLQSKEIKVECWQPSSASVNPLTKISEILADNPLLIVTDFDLTKNGIKGLIGPSIVEFCQNSLIPVCEYSRQSIIKFPETPNLYKIYLSRNIARASHEIASICLGFKQVRDYFNEDHNIKELSYATALANLLERDKLYYEFSKYIESYNKVNQFIVEEVKKNDENGNVDKMKKIFVYMVGHVLLNTILRYPGPIISENVLCAYMGVSTEDSEKLGKKFTKAIYSGPFDKIDKFYWLEDVDRILEKVYQEMNETLEIDQIGEFNHALALQIEPSLRSHNCVQCKGKFGGYYCPFTKKTVCDKEECSIVSDRWLPNGANMCRIHRSYYDGWEPLFQI